MSKKSLKKTENSVFKKNKNIIILPKHHTLGVDIGSKNIKLAVVRGDRITAAVSQPIPNGVVVDGVIEAPDILIKSLRQARKRLHSVAGHGTLCLSGKDVIMREITLPQMKEDQVLSNIKNELSNIYLLASGDYMIDYRILATINNELTGEKSMRVLVVSAPKSLLADYIKVCKRAGIRLERIDVLPNAHTKLIRKIINDQEKLKSGEPSEVSAEEMQDDKSGKKGGKKSAKKNKDLNRAAKKAQKKAKKKEKLASAVSAAVNKRAVKEAEKAARDNEKKAAKEIREAAKRAEKEAKAARTAERLEKEKQERLEREKAEKEKQLTKEREKALNEARRKAEKEAERAVKQALGKKFEEPAEEPEEKKPEVKEISWYFGRKLNDLDEGFYEPEKDKKEKTYERPDKVIKTQPVSDLYIKNNPFNEYRTGEAEDVPETFDVSEFFEDQPEVKATEPEEIDFDSMRFSIADIEDDGNDAQSEATYESQYQAPEIRYDDAVTEDVDDLRFGSQAEEDVKESEMPETAKPHSAYISDEEASSILDSLMNESLNVNVAKEEPEKKSILENVCLIDIGFTMSNVTFIRNGSYSMHKNIRYGGEYINEAISEKMSLDMNSAENFKLSMNNDKDGALYEYYDSIITELDNTMYYYKTNNNQNGVDCIVIAGGSSRLGGIKEYFSEQLGVPVFMLSEISDYKISPKLIKRQKGEDIFFEDYLGAVSITLKEEWV